MGQYRTVIAVLVPVACTHICYVHVVRLYTVKRREMRTPLHVYRGYLRAETSVKVS